MGYLIHISKRMGELLWIEISSDQDIHIPWILNAAAAAAKSLQSCPTLSDPMDCGPPGSSVHGIFQARLLEWVSLPSPTEFSRSEREKQSGCMGTDICQCLVVYPCDPGADWELRLAAPRPRIKRVPYHM